MHPETLRAHAARSPILLTILLLWGCVGGGGGGRTGGNVLIGGACADTLDCLLPGHCVEGICVAPDAGGPDAAGFGGFGGGAGGEGGVGGGAGGEGGFGGGAGGEGGFGGGAGGEGGGVCMPQCAGRVCGPDRCGGVCGPECPAGSLCDEGQCTEAGCDEGRFECAGRCVDFLSDPDHCGNCESPCPDGEAQGALPVCAEARCGLACIEGNGERVVPDFQQDAAHCGRCNNACPSAEGGQPRCSGGRCANPCSGDALTCDGRCVGGLSPTFAACARQDAGCCRVGQPGTSALPPASVQQPNGLRIVVAARSRLSARITSTEGRCPVSAPGDLPDVGRNDQLRLQLYGLRTDAQLFELARGVNAKGEAEGVCGTLEVDLPAGTYWLATSYAEAFTGAAELSWSLQPVDAPAAAPQTLRTTGAYRVNLPGGEEVVELPLSLAQASRVQVRLLPRVEAWSARTGNCRGQLSLRAGSPDRTPLVQTDCGALDHFLPAGDYVLRLSTRDALAAGDALVQLTIDALRVRAVNLSATETYRLAEPLPAGEVLALTYRAGQGFHRVTLQGLGCPDVLFRRFDASGFQQVVAPTVNDCYRDERDRPAGNYTLWVHHQRHDLLQPISVQLTAPAP